jgi:KaiC/GvpD/RAD55 family RecA-like ATPase
MNELVKCDIAGIDELLSGGLPKGCAILLITPPIIEKQLLCLEYIYRGVAKDEPGIIVTTDDSPENLKDKAAQYNWMLAKAEQKKYLKWVDSYSINANRDVRSDDAVKRIGGPIALSDMAIAISEIQAQFFKMKDYFRFVFDSLSTLLMYSSPDTIYYFLQSIVPKIKASGGVGFFTLSGGMHDLKVVVTMRHMMDGAIEIDDSLNLRILNLPFITKTKNAHLTLSQSGFAIR